MLGTLDKGLASKPSQPLGTHYVERGMLESVSRHFHEGMAGIKLLTAMPSSQQNNSSHSSMGSGSGSRHFHEGHSRL